MPNTNNPSGYSASGKNAAYTIHEDQPGPTGSDDIASQPHEDTSHAANAPDTASASSSDSNPEAAFALLQQIAPDMPPDQHALNDLSELHNRSGAAAAAATVPVSVQNMQPTVRQLPSRGSSFASSRGGSAVRRTSSNVAPQADSAQLTLQGLAIV